MQFLVILAASVILMALIFLSLGLKSLLSRNKSSKITSCDSTGGNESGCGCCNAENCFYR
jgi:hypothetical protein